MKPNFKSFKSLREYLSSISCINCGGCGYSAFFIYEFFKSKGKNPEIAFIYDDNPYYEGGNYKTNDAILKNHEEDAQPGSCAHAVVKIGEFAYDSNGIRKWNETLEQWSEGENLYHIIDEKFLMKSLANKRMWNRMFDRDQQVPEMEKKIGINLPTS